MKLYIAEITIQWKGLTCLMANMTLNGKKYLKYEQ